MELLLVLFIAVSIRVLFIFTKSSDDYVHFWNFKYLKHTGWRWHSEIHNSVLKGWRGYPLLNHKLISCFPEKYWGIVGRILNISYDCIVIIMAYFLTKYYFSHYDHAGMAASRTISEAGIVALLTATSPILLPVTARVKAIGARTLGFLLSVMFYLLLGWWFYSQFHLLLLMAIIIIVLISFSSQFALQNLVFTNILISIFMINIVPVLLFVPVILFAVILKKKSGLLRVYIHKINHFSWYFRQADSGNTAINRNSLKDLISLPVLLFTDAKKFIKIVLRESSYIIALYSVTSLFILIGILIKYRSFEIISSNIIFYYLFSLVAASLILFLLTSQKKLQFLGQAERYFEYTIPYVSFLLVVLFVKYNLPIEYLVALLIFQIFVSLLLFFSSLEKKNNTDQKDYHFSKLTQFLAGLDNKNILTIPAKLSFKIASRLFAKHNYYYRFVNIAGDKGFRYMDEDFVRFDLVKPDLSYFRQKYSIDIVVVDKDVAKKLKRYLISYDLGKYDIMLDNDNYSVYSLVS